MNGYLESGDGVSINEEKSWYCIALHLGVFIDNAKENKKADFARPCEICKYNKECDFDVIPYFKLLQEKSGIKFSFGRNRTMEDINDL